ncbi:MAG: S24/S26 family peptidase [Chloroflexi bacterium]|nr:S24/S26 family peptidase [Chloroflexota bacterium]MCY3696171.1 S24/S26 family peptidase [Chloroflexota bacterium]
MPKAEGGYLPTPAMLYFLRVQGDSMSPSLRHGDRLFALTPRLFPIRPGRVIAFRRNGELYLKRVLSREGEGWFVVGDNPSRSTDSRRFGPVPPSAVEAVAVCRVMSFRRL